VVVNSYGVDTNWYSDTGATDHITGELDKLTVRDHYQGSNQIHNANGQGMDIHHIGHSLLRTPNHNLRLNNILHVPQATSFLLTILPKITMVLLNIGLIIFFLRIRTRGKFFFKVDLLVVYIRSLLHRHPLHPRNKPLVCSPLHIGTGV
jgi:hypothetical protein